MRTQNKTKVREAMRKTLVKSAENTKPTLLPIDSSSFVLKTTTKEMES
jgi:hypothetical protein